jgi:hypothetical protein
MFEWWSTLGRALQIFYGIAITTSVLMLFQLVLMLIGMDSDSDFDVDDLDDHGTGGILSLRTVTAFFVGFGWSGVAAIDAGWSLLPTIVVATAVGSAFMGGVFLLMRTLYSMRYTGTLDYHNAIGNVGNVYLRIPAAMAGPGQVEVLVQGRLRVVQAFTRAGRQLGNNERVRVTDLMDETTLLVEPLDEPPPAEEG